MKLPESQLPGEDMARVRIKREQEWEGTGKKGRNYGRREMREDVYLSCEQAEYDINFSVLFSGNINVLIWECCCFCCPLK